MGIFNARANRGKRATSTSSASSTSSPGGNLAPAITHQPPAVRIRWMIRCDLLAVLAIERASFPDPWNEEDFTSELRQRNCIGMVAERNDRIVGYMLYHLHRNRLEVVNFAVQPDSRRTGVGRSMIEKLAGKCSHQRRRMLAMNLRETNLAGQLFLARVGFRAVNVLKGWCDDTGEDAYQFVWSIKSPDDEEVSPVVLIAD